MIAEAALSEDNSARSTLDGLNEAKQRLQVFSPEHPLSVPTRVSFRLAGMDFRCLLSSAADGKLDLTLTAALGQLRFSDEDADARRDALAFVAQPPKELHATLWMSSTGHVAIKQVTRLSSNINSVEFIAVLSQLLIALLPTVVKVLQHLAPADAAVESV